MQLKVTPPKTDRLGAKLKALAKRIPWKRIVETFLMALVLIREKRIHDGRTTEGRPLLDGVNDRYSRGYEHWKGGDQKHTFEKISWWKRKFTSETRKKKRIKAKNPRRARRKLYTPEDRLVLSGMMLGSQQVELSDRGGRLIFGDEVEAKKAHWNNRLRPFIAFTKHEIKKAWRETIRTYKQERGK